MDGSQGYVVYDGYSEKDFEAGIWNVLPTQPYDHLSIVGGIFSNTASNIRPLYLDLIDNVVSTYDSVPATSVNLPFFNFWSDKVKH